VANPALNEDFADMLEALAEARVEFIVVGAHALAAHGYPRATGARECCSGAAGSPQVRRSD
jgi:hypothetical protein